MSDDKHRKPPPALDRNTMAAIGRQLRAMYDHIVAEGVPERFAAILRRLNEASDQGSNDKPPNP
jgi:hypothetical protein